MLLHQNRTGLYTQQPDTQSSKTINADEVMRLDTPFFPGKSERSRYYVDQKQWFNLKWRAFTPTKAFMLNAAIVAFSVSTATELRNATGLEAGGLGWLICLSITFGIAFVMHQLFYGCFVFGSGMIASQTPVLIDAKQFKQMGAPDAYMLSRNNVHVGPSMHPTVSAVYFQLPSSQLSSGFKL